MSDTEYEKFEINDYDLENEFNPYRNNRKRASKNQQIYGIWAENSDDDEDVRGATNSGTYRTDRRHKNYSGPIGFVAGGVQQSGKKKENEEANTGNYKRLFNERKKMP